MTNLLLFCVAQAADPAFTPSVKPSATVFFHYGYDLSDAAGFNEFAFDRGYFRIDAEGSERFGGRLTLDADRMKATDATGEPLDTKYRVFVKHAYVEARELPLDVKLRAGVVDTPYAPFYDSFWGNRYIAKSMVDENKVLDTADLGVGLWGKHAGGVVDWNLSLLNGEGYAKLEADAGKAVQARVTVDPLAAGEVASLPITGFASYSGGESPVVTYVGAAGFQMPYVAAWGEYVGREEGGATGAGWSATLNPRLPDVLGLVARYDRWDPDADAKGDDVTKLIGGVEKDFSDKIALALTYERTVTGGAGAHGVYARMGAGF
ncbi:MAG: hypothetical protein ACOZNI_21395 [Myxococcota bacterium]